MEVYRIWWKRDTDGEGLYYCEYLFTSVKAAKLYVELHELKDRPHAIICSLVWDEAMVRRNVY